MRLARPSYDDEIAYSAEVVGLESSASEFNILEKLWNARVTSHIPLAEVAARLTKERISRALKLTDSCMRSAGFPCPRIAVAGLNPHAGDGGNFGREEIDVIAPVVEVGKREGIFVEGPFPADTVFLRAKGGAFDAVLAMYHDQGQIAMKLMGFDRGATLLGGFPFPICTPAHGTAYDIAGKGRRSIDLLNSRIGQHHQQSTTVQSPASQRLAPSWVGSPGAPLFHNPSFSESQTNQPMLFFE